MACYANALSFVLVIVLLTTLEVEARETKYFSKFNPQVDQPSLKPSSEIKNYNGENHEIDIPSEEFIANINKHSSESNAFSRNYDERSYVTVPQGYKEKDSNEFYYPNKFKHTTGMHDTSVSINDKFELTAEEKKFFNEKEGMNGYTTTYNNDHENVYAKESQGMSDTRTLENGKYYYNPMKGNRGSGKYNEYFGNNEYKSKYDEFRPLEDFEFNPQNQVGFVP